MFCPECGNHAANKALRMLGIQDNTHSIKWAYTENTNGLVTSSNGIHVKVSGLTPSIEELEGGIVSAVYDGDVATVTLTNGTTLIGLDGMTFATEVMLVVYRDNYSNEELVPGVVFPEKGIYMANNEGMTIELSYGSIHPIDQKYLPGVCLPVVEITSAKYPDDSLVNPSADESAKLEAAHQNGGVMIIKFEDAAGIAVTAVCSAMVQSGITIYFAIPNYQFMRTAEGVWIMGSGTLEASASE